MNDQTITLDVREDIRQGREPFSRIMRTVGRLQAGEDAKERRLATAIAPHQPDAVAFVDGECRALQHRAPIVAHCEFSSDEDGGHVC